MTQPDPQKFIFNTVFEGENVIAAPRAKRYFSETDIEEARRDGFVAGEKSALALREAEIAEDFASIAVDVKEAVKTLTHVIQSHLLASTDLALICARKIADAALDLFPEAPIRATLQAVARELATEPRLMIRARPESLERIKPLLQEVLQGNGLTCQILTSCDESLANSGFSLDWGDGRARFDPDHVFAILTETLMQALIAEGMAEDDLIKANMLKKRGKS